MNSDIQLAVVFFLTNFYLKQCIGWVYVMNDFICMGLLELQESHSENYVIKNSCPRRVSNSRPLNC